MAVLLSYLFYFTAASASPLQRRWLAKKHDGGGQVAFAFQTVLIVAVLGVSLILFFPLEWHGALLKLVVLALVCAVSGATHFTSNYSAQPHVDAGVSVLLVNTYTPVAIILATIFLSEGLHPLQIFGAGLLLVAMVLVSKKHRISRFKFDKYFWLMVLSGISLGVLLSAERALMKTTGFATGTMLSWWSQVLGLGLAVLITKSQTTYSTKDSLITGVLKFGQALSWVLLLYFVGNLSVVSAVTTFKVVVIFVAAALFLHEREDLPRKIVGSFIAVAGLLLMK